MKRPALIILGFIYLLASTGAMVNLHYCMGNLVEWTVVNSHSDTCGKCGMAKSDKPQGCCKDEEKFIKNTDDQKTAGQIVLAELIAGNFEGSVPQQEPVVFAGINLEYPVTNAPPGRLCTPIFIRNSVFRI